MADIFSKQKRSKIMSKISGKETKPEILVRSYLFREGFRFRKNDKRYPGKPDIFLPKYKTAVFVHGCFWHRHNCKKGKLPKKNREFWEKKINDNVLRDKKNIKALEELGLKVIVLWQCELRNKDLKKQNLLRLVEMIKSNLPS
ncbi:very short patch repair endonuclease [Salegentibacter chungangensis]|uniref:Very short patch repair endonuclease n=1 Tax=Salegentibacter chungangensis TaxID=1335724 RepID=A0ABW3NQB3_9FLAO